MREEHRLYRAAFLRPIYWKAKKASKLKEENKSDRTNFPAYAS
jgi:hypothetical protein